MSTWNLKLYTCIGISRGKFEYTFNKVSWIKQMDADNEMSTNVLTSEEAQFDLVGAQILRTFNLLIEDLISRRNSLLLRLSQIQKEYIAQETSRRAAVEEIERAQRHMQLLSFRENRNIPIHIKASEAYKEGLQQLQKPSKLICPQFLCPTIQQLKFLIDEFGEVVELEVPDYSLKKEPVLTAGEKGEGVNELIAAGLSLDEDNQLIFIADCVNKRIRVVSYEGQFFERFGQDKLMLPWGIAVTKEHIFITDIGLHALLQFDKNSHQLVRRTGAKGSKDGEFNYPHGVCIDDNGGALVADKDNNRISIFSNELHFISNFGNSQLKEPTDVKQTSHCVVVVLDRNPQCIHFFSKNGHFLSSCISRGEGPDCVVNNPYFFCIDQAGNIIMSDFGNHTVKIFSKSEQLIHAIGRKGEERGEFNRPYGVCITKLGAIFVVSHSSNFSIQCF